MDIVLSILRCFIFLALLQGEVGNISLLESPYRSLCFHVKKRESLKGF